MDKICDLQLKIAERAINSIVKMMGYDINNLEKDEIEGILKEYIEQYFFNPPDGDFTVLKVEVTDPQKEIADYVAG